MLVDYINLRVNEGLVTSVYLKGATAFNFLSMRILDFIVFYFVLFIE